MGTLRVGDHSVMRIENERYTLDLDDRNGAITGLRDRAGDLDLITSPRLVHTGYLPAGSFKLLLPLPGTEANYILGRDQVLTGIREIPAGEDAACRGAILTWSGPLTGAPARGDLPCGRFDLDVTATIRLQEDTVTFQLQVTNRTRFKLAEVWFPILGGITGVGPREQTRALIPLAGTTANPDLFQNFHGMVELGTPAPECSYSYPGRMPMPWLDFYNPVAGRGVYFGCHEGAARSKALWLALYPGLGHGRRDNWPRADEVAPETYSAAPCKDGAFSGEPVGLAISWINFPYTPPAETFEGPEVVLRCHDGDWHEAARYYRSWFAAAYNTPSCNYALADAPKSWIHQEMAFQNTMFLLPEGNILWTFRDIPRWAAAAAECGVRSLLISGWNVGGHDNHYPMYEPDPRLGTWEELADGIRACHRLGCKVYFFVNLQPVDVDTDWYRRELQRYRSMDPWGVSVKMGWGMGTLAARMGLTKRSVVWCSPSIPEFRRIIVSQMARLASIGADGLHLDKLAWGDVLLDFNPELKVSPDRATWEGILQAVDEILSECRALNPDFAISYEGLWDRLLPYSDVVWAWHNPGDSDHTAAFKYAFPQWIPGLSISQPYDYNVVNTAVRYGYQLFIGPAHYTSSLGSRPMRALAWYIKEVLTMRQALKEFIYLSEFLDVEEAQVACGSDIRFNTHRNRATGQRACVLANYGESVQTATIAFTDSAPARTREAGQALVYRPGCTPEPVGLPITLAIPAERLAVVVES